MEQKLKELVSTYINIPGDQITADTVIDRSMVPSSIVLHRMYAKLAENGFKVDNYWNIKTFGSLLQQNNGHAVTSAPTQPVQKETSGVSSGIDVEEVSAMPVVEDFREDEFYKMNFSPSEISHCILQPDPYASFAGLFALKEAIVKCDNSYKNRELSAIQIDHSPAGKPLFPGFQVSISHTHSVAVAMAIRINKEYFNIDPAPVMVAAPPVEVKSASRSWPAWLALLISLVAIGLTMYFRQF